MERKCDKIMSVKLEHRGLILNVVYEYVSQTGSRDEQNTNPGEKGFPLEEM